MLLVIIILDISSLSVELLENKIINGSQSAEVKLYQ